MRPFPPGWQAHHLSSAYFHQLSPACVAPAMHFGQYLLLQHAKISFLPHHCLTPHFETQSANMLNHTHLRKQSNLLMPHAHTTAEPAVRVAKIVSPSLT